MIGSILVGIIFRPLSISQAPRKPSATVVDVSVTKSSSLISVSDLKLGDLQGQAAGTFDFVSYRGGAEVVLTIGFIVTLTSCDEGNVVLVPTPSGDGSLRCQVGLKSLPSNLGKAGYGISSPL